MQLHNEKTYKILGVEESYTDGKKVSKTIIKILATGVIKKVLSCDINKGVNNVGSQ